MPYGGVKIDNITFTNAGVDANVTVSGLYAGITSGITVTGTVSGNTIQGQTISGVTVTGTTSNFASGVFTTQLSGATITGTTGNFTSLTAVTGTFTTRLSGATITGNTGQFTNITGVAIGATTVTGTTVTGTTANFVTGIFTTQLSGVTITGTTASFTSGVFTTLTGGTINTASFSPASLVVGSGSVTAPSFSFSGDSNTGLYSPSGDVFGITTSGTGKLTVDNTTAPVKEVFSGIFYPVATQVDVGTDANQIPLNQYLGSMAFQDSASVTITSLVVSPGTTNNLLVGTSTARSNFFGTTLSAVSQIEGTGGAAGRGSFSVINNDVSNNPPYILLGRSGAASFGSNALVVSGSRLGTLTFQGTDGVNFDEAATVAGEVDGTPGTNDMPGRLVFSTTLDGASSPTERMRIDNAGRVLVGTSTANTSGAKLQTSDGLTFPATAVASADPNTLDDYEEGTWTPGIAGLTTAGSATYTVQTGFYTKIGRLVYVWGDVRWSAGTGTGVTTITGLPFTISNGGTGSGFFVPSYLQTIPLSASNTILLAGSGTAVYVNQFPVGGGTVTSPSYITNGIIQFGGVYNV